MAKKKSTSVKIGKKVAKKAIKEASKSKCWWVILLFVVVLAIGGVAIYYFLIRPKMNEQHEHTHACGDLNSISLVEPSKKQYELGEDLDIAGGKVILHYEGCDETNQIDMTTDMVSGFDNANEAQQLLTVTYQSKTATFYVTVGHPAAPLYANLDFHFLELGNANTGDSVFIKAGENDILIDAGSTYGSYDAIKAKVDTYCTDGKLEYVIATHPHMDHIAAFSNNKTSNPETGNGILYNYDIGTIIDFDQPTAVSAVTTAVTKNYRAARDYAVSKGAKHYTAIQCTNESDGAKKIYNLGEGVNMEILYQKFYDAASVSDINNYSVVTLFTQGERKFLLTGDLEESGEKSLINKDTAKGLYNYNLLKDGVELFKAGHHGSYTASSDDLLSVIKPRRCVVCCCAGNKQYVSTNFDNIFPSQAFCGRMAKYTDEVYVTTLGTLANNSDHVSFNGQVNVLVNGSGEISVQCANSNTYLKDSEWLKKTNDLYLTSDFDGIPTQNRYWEAGKTSIRAGYSHS